MKERKFFDIHDLFKPTSMNIFVGDRGYDKTYKKNKG